jgi:chromosome segregation ATPase
MGISIDDLPRQFEDFLESAQAVLNREVEKGRKTRDALKAENATLKTENAALKDQVKAAQGQLSAALSHLQRAETLAAIDHETAEGRKTLDGLKGEIAKSTTALADLTKQCKETENRVNELNAGLAGLRQERIDATAAIDNARKLVNSFA